MAHDGLARAISPVHTSMDGDLIFAASVGGPADGYVPSNVPPGLTAAPDVVGAWGARVVERAVLRAVRSATGLPGFPAVSELGR
jgi:L-aminopeptidase/D-esterase-like protein